MITQSILTFLLLTIGIFDFGLSFEDIDRRVYNGYNARKGQFPYVVFLFHELSDGSTAGCTGALISDRWILSAAHCPEGAVSAKAFLGLFRKPARKSDNVLEYKIRISDIHVNPRYLENSDDDDIALYGLPTSVPLSSYPNIGLIALPKKSDVPVENFDNQKAVAAGWGYFDDKKTQPNRLKYGPVGIEKHSKCAKQVKKATYLEISGNQICVDMTYKHRPCEGDSGGPLIVNGTDGKPVVLGAVSFGIDEKCSTNIPVVYTFVPPYLDWINSITGIKVE